MLAQHTGHKCTSSHGLVKLRLTLAIRQTDPKHSHAQLMPFNNASQCQTLLLAAIMLPLLPGTTWSLSVSQHSPHLCKSGDLRPASDVLDFTHCI